MIKLKNLIESFGWGGIIQVQNYWVRKDGKQYKVPTHGSYAATLSGFRSNSDEAYQWMFDHGWLLVLIEGHELFVRSSLTPDGAVRLTRGQREWLKTMRDDVYKHFKLEIVDTYRRPVEV